MTTPFPYQSTSHFFHLATPFVQENFNYFLGIDSASDIPLPARPSPRAVANKRKRQTNSKSPDETAIWEDSEYRDLKNDHLRYQVEELKTRIEKNKAATQESNLKGQFWEKAAQAMENNNLVLELRSAVQVGC